MIVPTYLLNRSENIFTNKKITELNSAKPKKQTSIKKKVRICLQPEYIVYKRTETDKECYE